MPSLQLGSAAITKYHKLGGLKKIIFSQLKLLVVDQGAQYGRFGESSPPDSQMTSFSVSSQSREGERMLEQPSSLVSFFIGARIHYEVPPHPHM